MSDAYRQHERDQAAEDEEYGRRLELERRDRAAEKSPPCGGRCRKCGYLWTTCRCPGGEPR